MQELSPRLRIGSAPYSSVAKRVHAIHNGAALRSVSTVAATDSVRSHPCPSIWTATACRTAALIRTVTALRPASGCRKRPEILYQAWDDGIAMYIDDLSSSSAVTHDLDADGVLDMVISRRL